MVLWDNGFVSSRPSILSNNMFVNNSSYESNLFYLQEYTWFTNIQYLECVHCSLIVCINFSKL